MAVDDGGKFSYNNPAAILWKIRINVIIYRFLLNGVSNLKKKLNNLGTNPSGRTRTKRGSSNNATNHNAKSRYCNG